VGKSKIIATNGIRLGEVAEPKSLIEKQNLKLWTKVYLEYRTAILPIPC
jgi:hypothetical protein